MLNPQDTAKIADRIEEMVETPVSEKIVKLLDDKERAYLASLMYKWTQVKDGNAIKEEMLYILDKGKARLNKKEPHGTAQYLKIR